MKAMIEIPAEVVGASIVGGVEDKFRDKITICVEKDGAILEWVITVENSCLKHRVETKGGKERL